MKGKASMNNLAPVLSKAEIGSISTLGLAY